MRKTWFLNRRTTRREALHNKVKNGKSNFNVYYYSAKENMNQQVDDGIPNRTRINPGRDTSPITMALLLEKQAIR